MPVVPYQRQVSPTGAPTPQMVSPQLGDAGAQARETGQGLSNLGQSISKIELDAANEANQLRVQDAGNAAVTGFTELSTQFNQLRGADAMKPDDNGKSPLQNYQEQLQGKLRAIRDGLGNDAQRQAFDLHAAQLTQRFNASATTHIVGQQKVYDDSVQDGSIAASRQMIAADPANPDAVDQGINAINFAVARKAQGLAPEYVKALQDEATSKTHADTIKTLLDSNNAEGALAYFDRYKDTIDPLSRATIKDKLDKEAAVTLSIKAVDSVWTGQGPKEATDPVMLADMETALREKYGKDPDTLRASIADLRQRASAWNAQQAELKASNASKIWQLVDAGQGIAAIRQTPEWRAMSGTEQHEIIARIESEQTTRANRAAALSARELTDLQRQDRMAFMTHADSFLKDSDPAYLIGVSRATIEAKRTQYGAEKTQELLNRWDSIDRAGPKRDANITAIKLTDDEMEAAAWKNGILPAGKTFAKASAAQQEQYMQFRDGVQARINDYEQTHLEGKRKATQQEIRQVMDSFLTDKAFVPGGWTWNGYDRNKVTDPTPLYKMTPDDLAKASVMVGDQRVKLADIPPDFRTTASRALVSRGRPVTQQAIADMWMWQQNQSKSKIAPTEQIPK